MAEEGISELEDVTTETPKIEKQREKKRLQIKPEWNMQELRDSYKTCNIGIMGIEKREKKRKNRSNV